MPIVAGGVSAASSAEPSLHIGFTTTGTYEELHGLASVWGGAASGRKGEPPPPVSFAFYSGRSHPALVLPHGIRHVRLDVSDQVYPPVEKNLRIWSHLLSSSAQWYARCDADSFPNVRQLVRALLTLSRRDPARPWYTGLGGEGRTFERAQQNITFTYAMGGTCEFLSAAAARLISDKLPGCMEWSLRAWPAGGPAGVGHSDVEFGRCMHRHGLRFATLPHQKELFKQVYTKGKMTRTERMSGIEFGQPAVVVVPRGQPQLQPATKPGGQSQRGFLVLHPVKSRSLALYLADVVQRGLTPIARGAMTTCTHSPEFQRFVTACCNSDKYGGTSGEKSLGLVSTQGRTYLRCADDHCSTRLPECAPTVSSTSTASGMLRRALGVVVSLAPLEAATTRYRAAWSALLGVELRILPGVIGSIVYRVGIDAATQGELGLRDTFRRAVTDAIAANASALVWLEDDAIPSKIFKHEWAALQQSRRCFGFLKEPGGVLLLGASEWTRVRKKSGSVDRPASGEQASTMAHDAAAARISVAELVAAKRKQRGGTGPFCYNAYPSTSGTFAQILSAHVLPLVLEWLGASNRPIDHVFEYLQVRGYPVRAAYPFLAVMDVSHESKVANPKRMAYIEGTKDSRRKMYHDRGWTLGRYVGGHD